MKFRRGFFFLTATKMILFPNAKINIGLYVIAKREDGYHDIETIFYPSDLTDILEIKPAKEEGKGKCTIKTSGLRVDCPQEKNLIYKAYMMLSEDYGLPAVNVHLHKIIPFQAGLGGGSSDAAFMLKGLNSMFSLGMDNPTLEKYAARLGCDCPFFIENKSAFATGRGDILTPIDLDLESGYTIKCIKPECSVSTKEAFAGIHTGNAPFDLRTLGSLPIEQWKEKVTNDFEEKILEHHPEIARLKERMYREGAVYASMSGSGSAVFGIFRKNKE